MSASVVPSNRKITSQKLPATMFVGVAKGPLGALFCTARALHALIVPATAARSFATKLSASSRLTAM